MSDRWSSLLLKSVSRPWGAVNAAAMTHMPLNESTPTSVPNIQHPDSLYYNITVVVVGKT